MRHLIPFLLLGACGPTEPADPDAPGSDDPVEPTDTGAGADSADTAAAEPLPDVPFYEVSCPADPGWDAADPCGGVAGCDLLIFEATCAFLTGDVPMVVAARSGDLWVPLQQVLDQPGPDLLDKLRGISGLPDVAKFPGGAVDEGRCYRVDPELPEVFEFSPQGLYTSIAHADHVACAQRDAPGVYGPVGYVTLPIQEACAEETRDAPGWDQLTDEDGLPVLRTHAFTLRLVYAGFLSELD